MYFQGNHEYHARADLIVGFSSREMSGQNSKKCFFDKERDCSYQWFTEFHYRQKPDWGHQLLRHFLGLSTSEDLSTVGKYLAPDTEDVVFVSLDVEGNQESHDFVREIVISTLHTRDLRTMSAATSPESLIRSFNFRFGRESAYSRKPPFLFGQSQCLEKRWIPWVIEKVLSTGSPEEHVTEPRRTV